MFGKHNSREFFIFKIRLSNKSKVSTNTVAFWVKALKNHLPLPKLLAGLVGTTTISISGKMGKMSQREQY